MGESSMVVYVCKQKNGTWHVAPDGVKYNARENIASEEEAKEEGGGIVIDPLKGKNKITFEKVD